MPAGMKRVDSVDDYIALYPEKVRVVLRKMRAVVHENAPGVRESISYGIPTFKLKGVVVHFGAYESHISLYPGSSGVDAFRHRLGGYELGRGTVRFPLDRPIPYDLIAEIVRYRAGEDAGRK